MKPYILELPKESLIERSLERNDYIDVFGIDIPSKQPILPKEIVPLFFKSFPSWFMGLMMLREGIAKMIGLKTADGTDVEKELKEFKGEVGESIALFHVLDCSKHEILSGETDKHLDFRLSFFSIPKSANISQVILATTVQYNGWLGKVYFFFVKPFHRLIVPILLKRIAKSV